MVTWKQIFPMVTCTLLYLEAWLGPCCQACHGGDLPQEVVMEWLKRQILEGLELDEPPILRPPRPPSEKVHRAAKHGARRVLREAQGERRHQETSQIIMFPSSDSTCLDTSDSTETSPNHFTYYFQPSLDSQEAVITSVDFWFYVGEAIAVNITSVPLYALTSEQELMQVAQKPSKRSTDGWTTYRFDHDFHSVVADGPFVLQARCPTCNCYASEKDKTPFLHVHTRSRRYKRPRRALSMTWSPEAIDRLQRPSSEKDNTDCKREQIEISFEELGWDNWIVHPKSFIFYYCHGNCSSPERASTLLGIHQCCAPLLDSMRSLRFTTTSDGGFSYKYEMLPNIIPEECHCI